MADPMTGGTSHLLETGVGSESEQNPSVQPRSHRGIWAAAVGASGLALIALHVYNGQGVKQTAVDNIMVKQGMGGDKCEDNLAWQDTNGHGCAWYAEKGQDACMDAWKTANPAPPEQGGGCAGMHCCACGGGEHMQFGPPIGLPPPGAGPGGGHHHHPPPPGAGQGGPPTAAQWPPPPGAGPGGGHHHHPPPPGAGPGGPLTAAQCVDTPGWKDSQGNGCQWYSDKPAPACMDAPQFMNPESGCAQRNCCACGGGEHMAAPPPPGAGPGGPPTAAQCEDMPGWKDSQGNGCQWYSDKGDSACMDAPQFMNPESGCAQFNCCACGGGAHMQLGGMR